MTLIGALIRNKISIKLRYVKKKLNGIKSLAIRFSDFQLIDASDILIIEIKATWEHKYDYRITYKK